jgi:hypothetical protein
MEDVYTTYNEKIKNLLDEDFFEINRLLVEISNEINPIIKEDNNFIIIEEKEEIIIEEEEEFNMNESTIF